jgi:cytoskeletal protein CcmA (bactofilin family)
MIAVPLAPALIEVLRRKDASPLPTRKDDGNIRNFARTFRRYIEPLQAELASCAERNSIIEARLRNGAYVLLVGKTGIYDVPEDTVQTLVLFAKQCSLPGNLTFTQDVYAGGFFGGGRRNCFRALLGEDDIYLGEESYVLRWLHAEGKIVAGQRSRLFGRASSEKAIYLSRGCTFERTHAPAIFTSIGGELEETMDATAAKPPAEKIRKLGWSRINGDLHLGSGEMFLGNIIVTGSIHIDERTRIFGSAKGNGEIHLREQAEVQGSLVSTRSIHIASNCSVKGPLLAENEIIIGAGTQIGTPNSPTTVSAPRIRIEPGCVVHGTLWARVEGRVEE